MTVSKPVELETPKEGPLDIPGTFGIVVAVLGGVNLLAGMAIPLIPWVLSGVFALFLIVLGTCAKPPLRLPVLIMGFVCLIPPVILVLVEVLPSALGRAN